MGIPKLYTRLITAEDIKINFGYDLKQMANQGHFTTIDEAVDAWLDEACESINGLITRNRGVLFARKLNLFLADDANSSDELYQAMYWAQMYEMRFFIDNGRYASVGIVDSTRKLHDDEAINILYANAILIDGVM